MPAKEANQVAIDALKQVLTLASLILALTVTFLKDALGASRGEAVLVFLMPMCWIFLMVALWTGWVAMADAARAMSRRRSEVYVFSGGCTRTLARAAQWCFLGAILCLGLFAVVNFQLFFQNGTPDQTVCPTVEVTPCGKANGVSELKPDTAEPQPAHEPAPPQGGSAGR